MIQPRRDAVLAGAFALVGALISSRMTTESAERRLASQFRHLWESVVTSHAGDYASVLGLLISVIGFGITIRNVRKSKQAAFAAELAARKTFDSVIRSQAIVDLSTALSI